MVQTMFTIVLIEPQIPPNTGNIGRLCGATDSKLDIVGKIGFDLSDRQLKRAGLDYWEHIDWHYFPHTELYMDSLVPAKIHLLTTKATASYTERQFEPGDRLIFGSETRGIDEYYRRKYRSSCCTIPMKNGNIRSLNLSTSVGIVLGEALRQNGRF